MFIISVRNVQNGEVTAISLDTIEKIVKQRRLKILMEIKDNLIEILIKGD